MRFNINSDITKAETLPATFYKDPDIFEKIKEKNPEDVASILLENCNTLIRGRNYKDAMIILERIFSILIFIMI